MHRARRQFPVPAAAGGRTPALHRRWAFAAALLMFTGVAVAAGSSTSSKNGHEKLYKWVDENGIVHYGDHVPAEFSKGERQVLNEQGVPIKTLQKELSPQEMAAELRRIELESARAQAVERATQRDRILLLSYLSVHEIEMLRDQRIGTLDGQLKVNDHYVRSLRNHLVDLENRARDYNYPFDPASTAPVLPDDLARELLSTVNQLSRREAETQRIREEQIQIATQFDADIERFKQLKPESAADETAASP
jgi:Domain of unknown function (DUF4124)